MCRIFGFRSVIQSQVHTSLVQADNALMQQSVAHPDGWGVSYYVGQSPHLIKSVSAAVDDHIFKQISGVVASETVVAHLRKATVGASSILNTHPFQFGRWVFAHNGNIKNYPNFRAALISKVDPDLRRYILGETDSEVLFYLLLTHLSRQVNLHDVDVKIDLIAQATKSFTTEVCQLVGPFEKLDGAPELTYLSFILTNGSAMLAHHGGKSLHYSTYKRQCPDRTTCASFAPECEAPTQSGFVNHLVFASEPLHGENIWIPMKPHQMVGVDCQMRLRSFN